MADPLSVTASLVGIIAAAVKSSKSLCATVARYMNRDKTLNRLHTELEDMVNILSSLEAAIDTEATILKLLKGPIVRCNQICQEFEAAMEKFGGKSKMGFVNWARMEFMTSDINGFMDTISGYKSTITVGLGTITMQNSKLHREVLQKFIEMIEDTAYNLDYKIQCIDEKLAYMNADSATSSGTSIDLQDEKEVTRQCIRICEKARSYIEFLQDEQPALLGSETPTSSDVVQNQFDAQLRTRQIFSESQLKFAETIGLLHEQLKSVVSNKGPGRDRERLQLQEDINISKQCLEVLKQASDQVSHQKVHIIGEVATEDDTDQLVVTTLADLFNVKKVLSKSRSAQLVGSMSDESLQKVSGDRYGSRFGAVGGKLDHVQVEDTTAPSVLGVKDSNIQPPDQTKKDKQPQSSEKKSNRPSPNEVRKRASGNDIGR